MLQVRSLDVVYGKSRILHGVSLEVADRPLAVVGRNGMGKTTLCHALMGMAPVTGGSARFDGVELVGRQPFQIAARPRTEAARRTGPESGSTTSSRGWPSDSATSARPCPAASSRCWRSPAP